VNIGQSISLMYDSRSDEVKVKVKFPFTAGPTAPPPVSESRQHVGMHGVTIDDCLKRTVPGLL